MRVAERVFGGGVGVRVEIEEAREVRNWVGGVEEKKDRCGGGRRGGCGGDALGRGFDCWRRGRAVRVSERRDGTGGSVRFGGRSLSAIVGEGSSGADGKDRGFRRRGKSRFAPGMLRDLFLVVSQRVLKTMLMSGLEG